MADATVLKTVGGNSIRVRVPSPAPNIYYENPWIWIQQVTAKAVDSEGEVNRSHG